NPERFEVKEQDSIPVEIVSIEDISKRQAVSKEAPEPEPEKKIAPPKVEEAVKPKPAPEVAKEVKEAAKEPQSEPQPKPEPKAEPEEAQPDPQPLEELIKETEAAPEPAPEQKPEEKKAEAKPVPVPKQKPTPPKKEAAKEKPKPEFNPDDVAALLNKIDDTRKSPPKPEQEEGVAKKAEFTSLTGADERLAADLVDALRRRIESCWSLPSGARDAQNLQIRIQFQLSIDGMLTSYPQLLNANPHPAFDAAARSAQAAVKQCEPYNFLPAEKYDLWHDIILTFDPSRMLATN
ncbi:MAG: hypothetical protein AB7E66_16075, partial [Parvibaculaceae bacterium]